MSTGELVSVDPVELKFPFELNKQISSSLQLTNKTDNHVGFKVKTTNPKKYCVRPNTGVVLPRSTCEIMVTMQAQKDAPPDMQCKDKFLLQSVVASPGATPKDITPEMFAKDSGRVVEECKLRVVYFPATPSTSAAIAQGTVDDVFSPKASPRASVIDRGNLSGTEASRRYVDSHDKSSEVRALISQLTDEKNAAIEQSNKIRKELEVLRQASNKSEGGGVSLIVAIIIALIGLILGYIMKN
ncbi:vesicle-associated protein 1-2-like [Cynara cardunculus var. scolymus]|uniref:vesicle-associated protein 1-2-like n=1 Tax=Cynara cardunculus var. scolymus TaxID=59895 RepID=UPI000D62815A|nr:vesicle-associated protein 1-2-like [Cynara cardunculus var. scolymus]